MEIEWVPRLRNEGNACIIRKLKFKQKIRVQ